MPSEEMLKKLLDEFAEKETFVQEELKVVNEQIEQLQSRLDGCRARLSTIGGDREKVLQIRERYADGTFYTPNVLSPMAVMPKPETTEPKAKPVEPKVEKKAVKAVEQPVKAVEQPVKAVEQPVKAVEQPVKAVEQPVKAVEQPVKAVEAPVVEPPTPIVQMPEPAPAVVQPAIEPVTTSPRRTQTGLNAILGARRLPDGTVSPPPPPADFGSDSSPSDGIQWAQPTPIDSVAEERIPPEQQMALEEQAQWEMAEADDQSGAAAVSDVSQQPQPQTQDTTASTPAEEPAAEQKVIDLGNGDEPAEEGDSDTVKSINDALRSLFR